MHAYIPVLCLSSELSLPGMDAGAKMADFPDDTDWRGLEDLYSVDESRYEWRPHFSLAEDDWTNFWKDVDSMFVLLSNFKKLNQTDELEPTAESGSGALDLEEASGAGGPVQPATTATPRLSTLPPLGSAPPQVEKKPHPLNDIPEKLPLWGKSPSTGETWAQQLKDGLDGDGLTFSGNSLTELETHHVHLLRLAPQVHQGPRDEEEDDIFLAQGYLPLSPQTERPAA